MGRLAKEKNWDTLLEAAAQLLRKNPHLQLVILGEGAERKDLLRHARNLGVDQQVDLPGNIPPAEIPGYLTAADIFCFASITETQGLVTMEAMAAGLPIAAIDATGTRDAVDDGVEGFLTDNNPPALAVAIERLLDGKLRSQFSQAAHKRAQTFGIRYLANQLQEIYRCAEEDAKAGRFVQCA